MRCNDIDEEVGKAWQSRKREGERRALSQSRRLLIEPKARALVRREKICEAVNISPESRKTQVQYAETSQVGQLIQRVGLVEPISCLRVFHTHLETATQKLLLRT